jgi:hypothetical protein
MPVKQDTPLLVQEFQRIEPNARKHLLGTE